MDEKELLEAAAEKFHRKVEEDERVKSATEGLKKEIRVEFRDGGVWIMSLENSRITSIRRGDEGGDITIITDVETFSKLLNEEMNPIVAYVRGKIKVRGEVEDLLALKSLLG